MQCPKGSVPEKPHGGGDSYGDFQGGKPLSARESRLASVFTSRVTCFLHLGFLPSFIILATFTS